MIAKAIDRILGLSEPHTEIIDDIVYCDKHMEPLDTECRAKSLHVHTLRSIVQYCMSLPQDRKNIPYIVHVIDPVHVQLVSCLDGDRKREVLMDAIAEVPDIPFGRYIDNEQMLITVQSMFADDPESDKASVLKFAGTVTSGSVKEYGDDGVTQKATIKQGVSSKAEAIVPSPCILRPFRTFAEVEPPASRFIFRMREGRGDTVESALFEADGGV